MAEAAAARGRAAKSCGVTPRPRRRGRTPHPPPPRPPPPTAWRGVRVWFRWSPRGSAVGRGGLPYAAGSVPPLRSGPCVARRSGSPAVLRRRGEAPPRFLVGGGLRPPLDPPRGGPRTARGAKTPPPQAGPPRPPCGGGTRPPPLGGGEGENQTKGRRAGGRPVRAAGPRTARPYPGVACPPGAPPPPPFEAKENGLRPPARTRGPPRPGGVRHPPGAPPAPPRTGQFRVVLADQV